MKNWKQFCKLPDCTGVDIDNWVAVGNDDCTDISNGDGTKDGGAEVTNVDDNIDKSPMVAWEEVMVDVVGGVGTDTPLGSPVLKQPGKSLTN